MVENARARRVKLSSIVIAIGFGFCAYRWPRVSAQVRRLWGTTPWTDNVVFPSALWLLAAGAIGKDLLAGEAQQRRASVVLLVLAALLAATMVVSVMGALPDAR